MTGRSFAIRLDEHGQEVEAIDTHQFTRETKSAAEQCRNKLAVTDHVLRENHVIYWDRPKSQQMNQTDSPEAG